MNNVTIPGWILLVLTALFIGDGTFIGLAEEGVVELPSWATVVCICVEAMLAVILGKEGHARLGKTKEE